MAEVTEKAMPTGKDSAASHGTANDATVDDRDTAATDEPAAVKKRTGTNSDDEDASQAGSGIKDNSDGDGSDVLPLDRSDTATANKSKEAPAASVTYRCSQQKKKRLTNRVDRTEKLFQDAITVYIPLNVTADLRTAIQRTRTKRIQSIYKQFPGLKREMQKHQEEENEDPMIDEDEDETNKESKEQAKDGRNMSIQEKKRKPSANIPQPHQYGSVLDYLEAKYVKGVMLGDGDEDGASLGDKSEGQGSVYSGGSFLDDADLQRDVAEQVMASTTMTKLELEEDDADFFVNVGNLEVEDNEYGDHYDPLQDKEAQPVKTKKRKKSQSLGPGSASKKSKTTAAKSKMKFVSSTGSVKSAKSTTSSKKSPKKRANTEEEKGKKKTAKQAKSYSERIFRKLVTMIKAMKDNELPRRKTKLKVALTCPSNKKAGDDITFT